MEPPPSVTMGQSPEKFADLTWLNLEEWAGSKVVGRGKTYKKRVADLRVTPEGALVARVEGTESYRTRVSRGDAGEISSACTCPFDWGPCKHAAAVILAALEALKERRTLPLAHPDSESFSKALEASPARDSAPRELLGSPPNLRAHLTGMSKEELMELVMGLAEAVPEVGDRLRDRQRLATDEIQSVVREVRGQIETLASQTAWVNSWSGDGHIPDYSGVRDRLESMLAAGYADEVVALGEELLRLGTEQVGVSDDEGETGMEIGRCLDVVFQALAKSSLSAADRILWEIEARMQDEYSLLDSVEDLEAHTASSTPEDWSRVADILGERLRGLEKISVGKRGAGFPNDWIRRRLLGEVVSALGNANREGEAIELLQREASATGCYPELVDRLLASGRREEARRWAETGFWATVDDLPGIAWDLEKRLRGMAEEDGDARAVAAYRAFEFFDRPGLGSYVALRAASEAAGVWAVVGPVALGYLESGEIPGELGPSDTLNQGPAPEQPASGHSGRSRAGKKGESLDRARKGPDGAEKKRMHWPLPSVGLRMPAGRGAIRTSPDAETLVRIAIHEERHDDALAWYQRIRTRHGPFGGDLADQIAAAVRETHPEVSLGIWRERAEHWIARVKPSAYQVAGRYLNHMEELYAQLGRSEEWRAYLAGLRSANRRRPRMLDVLDSVEGKRRRILDGS